MFVKVNPHSGVPLYVQIADEIRHLIAIGGLKPGDRLPTVRDLSAELGINPNTVQGAYQMLEREGLAMSKQGRGSFITSGGDDDKGRALKMDLAAKTIQEAMVRVLQQGLPFDTLEQICKDKLEELRRVRNEAREAVEAR